MHSKLVPADGGPKAALLVCTMKIKIVRTTIMSLIVFNSIFCLAKTAKAEVLGLSKKAHAELTLLNQHKASAYSLKPRYAVNMQDGGLILKEESDSPLNVNRTYRSRSLDHGFFGQGWCTDLESHMIFQGQGVIRLVNCQSSRPSLFKVNSTASSYINIENSKDIILIKLGYYERKIQNEWIAKYNFKGQLIEFRKDQKTTKIMYNSRSLPDKILFDDKLISFHWHPILDLIEQVKWGNQTQNYEYSGFNLTKIEAVKTTDLKIEKSLKNEAVTYAYDDLDNLTTRKSLSKSQDLEILYDKSADQVLKIEGQCHEVYTYNKTSVKRSVSTVSKACQNQSSKKEFIFEYAENSSHPTHITVNDVALTKTDRLALNQIQTTGESL